MEFHPLADLFPLLSGEEYEQLIADIRENGLLEPIVVHEGQILDGRNRWRACQEAGVQTETIEWDGECGDPAQYVIAKNIHRRHLTPSQRAMIATELLEYEREKAPKRQGTRTDLQDEDEHGGNDSTKFGKSRDKAGEALGVSGRLVSDAEKVKKADPERAEKVKSGEGNVQQMLREMDSEPLVEKFPEDEREHALAFLSQPSLSPDSREQAAENLLEMQVEDRMRVYGLSKSEAAKERSLARTEALQLPPEPDSRIVNVRAMVKSIDRYIGLFGVVADRHLQQAAEHLEEAVQAMEES